MLTRKEDFCLDCFTFSLRNGEGPTELRDALLLLPGLRPVHA